MSWYELGGSATLKPALRTKVNAAGDWANALAPNAPIPWAAATPKPPAIRARRDRYRSGGVMSDGRTLSESAELLRMTFPQMPKIIGLPGRPAESRICFRPGVIRG